MNQSHKARLSSERVNLQDQTGIDMMSSLTSSLYGSKGQSMLCSTATVQYRPYQQYAESSVWIEDQSQMNSSMSLQFKSQQHFRELNDELHHSKQKFYQTTNNLDYLEQRNKYKTGRRPAYLVEMSEENKQKLRQERLQQSIQYQKQLLKEYNEDLIRQKDRKIKQTFYKEERTRLRRQQAEEHKLKKQKEFEIYQKEQKEEIAKYRKTIAEKVQLSKQKQSQQQLEQLENAPKNDFENQKQQLFDNENIKQQIENIEIPQKVKDLSKQITENSSSTLESLYKVYLFFYYHMSFNYKEYKTGKQTSDLNPDKILEARTGTPLALATLFKEILTQMKIQSQHIPGIGKGTYNYTLGQKYKGNELNHVWNAVTYQGNIYFVDICWGTGYIEKDNFFKRLNCYYFLTPALEFLYSHFPQKKDNQFLKRNRQWPLDKFQNMPNFTPYYFQNKLQFYKHNTKAQIETNSDQVQFEIRSKETPHVFKAQISKTRGKPLGEFKSCKKHEVVDLENPENQNILQDNAKQCEIANQISIIDIKVPAVGNHILEFFAASQNSQQGNEGEVEWNLIAEYEIQYKK